jgi:uncharacterized protein
MVNSSLNKKTLFAIFKPTLKCNLRCKYCYATNGQYTDQTIEFEDIIETFVWLAEYCNCGNYNKIVILWHGGEPLLLSSDFLSKALERGIEIFNQHNIRCEYRIQSNLININPEIVKILHKYFNGRIGGSLDYKTHARLFKNGEDSSDLVLKNIKKLQEADVKVGIITMLCPSNIGCLNELYYFFKENKIQFQISRVIPSVYEKDFQAYQLTDEEYAKSMITLFDIWFDDKEEPVYISTFVELAASLLTNKVHICEKKTTCQPNYIGIAPDGSLFPCGRYGTEKYIMGNIHQISPKEYLEYDSQRIFADKYPMPEYCSSCRYLSICHGGCLYERIMCPSSKICASQLIYAHIEDRLTQAGLTRNAFIND